MAADGEQQGAGAAAGHVCRGHAGAAGPRAQLHPHAPVDGQHGGAQGRGASLLQARRGVHQPRGGQGHRRPLQQGDRLLSDPKKYFV